MLWQHDSRQPIGVYDEIKEDDNGLFVKGRLLVNDIEKAKEAYALIKAGAISGLSIGYTIKGSEKGKEGHLYLKELALWEISIVTFPANEQANVNSVKAKEIDTIRKFENFLREEGGFSASQAKRLAVQGFKSDCQRDVDDLTASLLASLMKLNQTIKG
jgi:HK97 family phage prohead protease